MQAAIPFPDLSPELFAFSVGGFDFALRWYALAYIAGLVIGWRLVVALVRRPRLWPGGSAPMTPAQVEELLTAVILGVILGGRLGYVLFYNPGYYLQHPVEALYVWQGGMSFHGGFLGVVVAALIFARRTQRIAGGIVAVGGVQQAFGHEVGDADRAGRGDAAGQKPAERRHARRSARSASHRPTSTIGSDSSCPIDRPAVSVNLTT